ncbi:MAG: hypothetical protein ACFB3T_02000 [Geminicoccaceae bacterium]
MHDQTLKGFRRSWFWWFVFWRVVHWVIGLALITLPALVTLQWARIDYLDPFMTTLSAILASVMTFAQPDKRAANFRSAWILLNRYEYEKAGVDPEGIEVYLDGEKILGQAVGGVLPKDKGAGASNA